MGGSLEGKTSFSLGVDCKIFLDLFLLALKLCQDKPVASQERHKASLHARKSEGITGQVFSPVELSSERNKVISHASSVCLR